MSIICGALCWLKDHEAREKRVLETAIEELNREKMNINDETADWVTSQARIIEIEHQIRILQQKLDRVKQQETKIEEMKKRTQDKVRTIT